MSAAYFNRYIVLKGAEAGGILGMEAKNGKVMISVHVKSRNREYGRLRLMLFTKDKQGDTFALGSLNETISLTRFRPSDSVPCYTAAAIVRENDGSVVAKGANCCFPWSKVKLYSPEQKAESSSVVPKGEHVGRKLQEQPAAEEIGEKENTKEDVPQEGQFSERQEQNTRKERTADGAESANAQESDRLDLTLPENTVPKASEAFEETDTHLEMREKEIPQVNETKDEPIRKDPEEFLQQDEMRHRETEQTEEKISERLPEKRSEDMKLPAKAKTGQEARTQEDGFSAFQRRWPGSEWRRVYYPGSRNKSYLVGKIFQNGEHAFTCYAIEGRSNDCHLPGDTYFQNEGKGYWLMFRNANL